MGLFIGALMPPLSLCLHVCFSKLGASMLCLQEPICTCGVEVAWSVYAI